MTDKAFEKYKLVVDEWINYGFITKKNSDYGKSYYVYALINSLNSEVFYIGKGKNKRAEAHFKEYEKGIINNYKKFKMISNIVSNNGEVEIHIIENNLTEKKALRIERYFISQLKNYITNVQSGAYTQQEKDVIWANDTLNRVLSFDDWVAKRNPKKELHSIYKYILNELNLIASERKVIVHGVEQITVNGVNSIKHF